MKHLCVLTFLALTLDFGLSQELEALPYSWKPEKLPNPLLKPRECGLGEKPGYICDPNTILTRDQRATLNWFLEGIANTINVDQCPCSRYHCENYQGQRFYKVAIALIPRLSMPRGSNGVNVAVLDQANNFAYRLENDLWNMSVCEEDIVILYSRDDKALVTMTGKTAGRKLTPIARRFIHGMAGAALADGRINEGLERMVYEIELVLNGEKNYDNLSPHRGTGHRYLGSSLLVLLLAVGSSWLTYALS